MINSTYTVKQASLGIYIFLCADQRSESGGIGVFSKSEPVADNDDERCVQRPSAGRFSKRSDAHRFDRAVKGLMVGLEPLVM